MQFVNLMIPRGRVTSVSLNASNIKEMRSSVVRNPAIPLEKRWPYTVLYFKDGSEPQMVYLSGEEVIQQINKQLQTKRIQDLPMLSVIVEETNDPAPSGYHWVRKHLARDRGRSDLLERK